MLYLADRLERSIDRDEYILHQPRRLVKLIAEGAGTLFDPEVVELFNAVADREEFWLDMVSPRLYSILLHYGPQENVALDTASIRPLSELFKNMIDFRSRFTATHSSGVAACAVMLGRLFGLTETEVEWMEIAGHLHDLGKLAIPNTILDKPAGLTTEEFEVIRSHTYFTYMVLTSIKGMERIAEWGAFHHERLDGTGYPFHCKAGDIDTGARIMMVADLFTALVEDRPYRPGMPLEKALGIIQGFKERDQLDASIVDLAADNADELQKYVADHQRSAREFYEQQFADLETG
jgi:HD-GYP domain-containing protein (c-di-GMP phosphodiesterase class II)